MPEENKNYIVTLLGSGKKYAHIKVCNAVIDKKNIK